MLPRLSLPLCAVALFCLTSMAGCPNNVPAGQLTEVKGRVVNVRTGRPMPGVRMVLGTNGSFDEDFRTEIDSTYTDLQGSFALRFTNQQGLYYGLSCESADHYDRLLRLDLGDTTLPYNSVQSLRSRSLLIGQLNTFKFKVLPRRVFAVQLTTRRTGYQQLRVNYLQQYPADNQRRLVYVYQSVPEAVWSSRQFASHPGTPPTVTFSRRLASGTTQDTTVLVQCRPPLTADTVQASLVFGQ